MKLTTQTKSGTYNGHVYKLTFTYKTELDVTWMSKAEITVDGKTLGPRTPGWSELIQGRAGFNESDSEDIAKRYIDGLG